MTQSRLQFVSQHSTSQTLTSSRFLLRVMTRFHSFFMFCVHARLQLARVLQVFTSHRLALARPSLSATIHNCIYSFDQSVTVMFLHCIVLIFYLFFFLTVLYNLLIQCLTYFPSSFEPEDLHCAEVLLPVQLFATV